MALSFITCKRPPIPNIVGIFFQLFFFFFSAVSFMLLCIFLILYESQTCFIQLDQYLPLKIHSFSIGLKLHFSENMSGTPCIGQDSRGFICSHCLVPFVIAILFPLLEFCNMPQYRTIFVAVCLFYFAIVSHFLLYMVQRFSVTGIAFNIQNTLGETDHNIGDFH